MRACVRVCVCVSPDRTGTAIHGQRETVEPWLNDRTTNLVFLGVASNNSFSIVGTVQLKETENVRKKNDRDGKERKEEGDSRSPIVTQSVDLESSNRKKERRTGVTYFAYRKTYTHTYVHTRTHARTQTRQSTNTRLC